MKQLFWMDDHEKWSADRARCGHLRESKIGCEVDFAGLYERAVGRSEDLGKVEP